MALDTETQSDDCCRINGKCDIEDLKKGLNERNKERDSKEKAEREISEKAIGDKKSSCDESPSSEEEKRKEVCEKRRTKKDRAKKLKENKLKKDCKEENNLQDVSFNVQIQPPSGSLFEIQVSSMELVQEIHQLLMDREDTCHRTCFSLMLDNVTLDNFSELKTIEGLKEGSVIRIVEQPYTMREARIHVRHVRDLLKSLDTSDAYNGVECASLSYLNVITQGDILDKRSAMEKVDCTPPDYIMPGSELRPLNPLQPSAKEQKNPKCLKVLNLSPWNPPPGPRKLHGDLLYLHVVTLEGRRFHITASTCGFYINLSTEEEFNPKPANPNYLSHSLIDLLNQVSNTFKRNCANLQRKRATRHPFERVSTPYQLHSWVSPHLAHSVDSLRAEDAFSSKLGYEEHIPGQTRDWNEELQTTRELSRKSLPERLLRERAIFKVHSDFVSAATRGAVAVVDGNVMAINPGEDPRMQMFIWNNIFFSLGFDVKDHYKEVGGDAAAFVAPKNDLQGVRVYSSIDIEGLYTLGTVVIDYRGYRVTAQSIIPGILEREQEQSVVYGSIDFGKTVCSHPKYMELLQKAGNQLKILPHSVLDDCGKEHELCSSIECKGIIGNDGRHYILDLLRTFPPDVNFLSLDEVELGPDSKKMGFPVALPHTLVTLRQELVDAFVDNRYLSFLRYGAIQLQQSSLVTSNERDNKEVEDASSDGAERGRESAVKAAQMIGSLKDAQFDIRFNPDVFSGCVKHAQADGDVLKKQRQLVVDAADFLVSTQLPAIINDLEDHSTAPADGVTLCEAMHNRGINLRYLGKIANLLKNPDLKYIQSIAVLEIIVRSVRHIFTEYMQSVETISMSAGVAHFLNCLLSACLHPQPPIKADELANKRRKKKSTASPEFASLTPKSLWSEIKSEVQSYFGFTLKADSVETICERYKIQKISLLRRFCQKCGVQLLLRDYGFESKTSEAFRDDDIINLFPVVKHISPRASDAFNLYTSGQSKIQQGMLKDGYELISEALNLLNNVYGAMHPEIAQCLRMLARINYIMGDYFEAMSFQQKATLMSERVNGIDHPYTITEYVHLSLYCFANQQVSVSLKLLYRARYLLTLIHGELHPEIALIDANIGLILHAETQYSLSLQFLENALKLNIIFYGDRSLKVALGHHLVARTQSCMGDFRSALRSEKETFTIYKEQLGPGHDKTKEADECLRHLTQQAVVMAKKINEVITGRIGMGLPPIQIQPPSMASVLELLNITNGILYIQITPAEVERLRQEMEKCNMKKDSDCQQSSSVEDVRSS